MDVGVTAEFDVDAEDVGGRRAPPLRPLPLFFSPSLSLSLSLSLFLSPSLSLSLSLLRFSLGGIAEEGRELSTSPLGKSDRGLSAESIYLFISA